MNKNSKKDFLEEMKELLFPSEEHQSFIDFVNKKYAKEIEPWFIGKKFTVWDDYALYLYYVKFKKNKEMYYSQLEDDLKEYSDAETKDTEEKYDGHFYIHDRNPEKW